MPRGKVKLAFIENLNERKASYKKRKRGFLKKAYELSTLCDVEMAIVIYSPCTNEHEVFPNNDAAINTFTKFSDEMPEMVKSKNMMAQKNFTEQRIKKIEEKLWKLKKENRVLEYTNKMHELLSGEDIHIGIHPYDLNDLSFVINQKLKQVGDAIKTKAGEEGSSSNAPQLDPNGTNFEGPRAPLLASNGCPTSMIHRPPPLVVPSTSQGQVFESMFHPTDPFGTPPQRVHLVDPSWVPPSTSFLSQMLPPMANPQTFSQVPPTMLASSIPSPMMDSPMSPSIFSQMNPSINIHRFGASVSLNNYQNYSVGFSQSPALPELTSPVVPHTFSQVPPTMLASPIPSPMMDPMSPTLFAQIMNPSMNIHPLGASVSQNNYQNYSTGIPQSPALPELTTPVVPHTFSQVPPTMLASPIPSPMMDPMSPTLFAQIMNPSMNIHPLDAPVSLNNYQNYSTGFSQSPALSEVTSPMVPPTFSQVPPTMLAPPIPSPMMDAPMSPSLFAQIDPSMNIHPLGASVNNQNNSTSFPLSPALSEMFNWNDDIMSLFDDAALYNINAQDNYNNNNNNNNL